MISPILDPFKGQRSVERVGYFNNTDNWVAFPDNVWQKLGSARFSIEFWIKVESSSNRQIILSKWNGNAVNDRGFAVSIETSGVIRLWTSSDGSSMNTVDGTTNITDNEWHYVLIDKNGTSTSIYIDSISESISGSTSETIYENDTIIEISNINAGTNNTFWVNGYIKRIILKRHNDNDLDVIIMLGQSNFESRPLNYGTLPVALQSAQTNLFGYSVKGLKPEETNYNTVVQPLYFDWWGPEITASKCITDNNSGRKIGFIKTAEGGTDMSSDWQKGSNTYNTAITCYKSTIENWIKAGYNPIVRQIWIMQGESDAKDQIKANNYYNNFIQFINDYAADTEIVLDEIKVVIGRISDNLDTSPTRFVYKDTVRSAQDILSANYPYFTLISTDALELNADDTHFSSTGIQQLGEAFASEVVSDLPYLYTGKTVIDIFFNTTVNENVSDVSENKLTGIYRGSKDGTFPGISYYKIFKNNQLITP